MGLEVRVQRARCIGSKTCISAAPGVFHIDYDNIALVIDAEAASEDQLIAAARDCPTGAISVTRDGEKLAGP